MAEKIFDTRAVRARMRKVGAAPVREEVHRRLRERLAEVKGEFARVAWVGEEILEEDFRLEGGPYDAVVVDGFLSVVEDVPVALLRCVEALRPDGLLLGWMLGVESFRELRAAWEEGDRLQVTGGREVREVPLTDVRAVGALLQRLKVALPVVDRDVLTVTFRDFAGLYAGLRGEGVGNFNLGRRKGLTGRGRLAAMEEVYRRLFPREDGRVPVTVEVIWLHGFKVGAGQPVALKPGGGKVSLVRILGDENETNGG